MSEPSLRDTAIAQALSVYVVEDLLGRHVPAGDAVRDFVTEGKTNRTRCGEDYVLLFCAGFGGLVWFCCGLAGYWASGRRKRSLEHWS